MHDGGLGVWSLRLLEGTFLSGGITKAQLAIFGEPWPPRAGWKQRICGTPILPGQYERVLAARSNRAKRMLSRIPMTSRGGEYRTAILDFEDKIARDG